MEMMKKTNKNMTKKKMKQVKYFKIIQTCVNLRFIDGIPVQYLYLAIKYLCKGHEGPRGDVDARVHIYTATALGRGRLASPTLDRLYPREESPRYSFCRRLSGSQTLQRIMVLGRSRVVGPTLGRL